MSDIIKAVNDANILAAESFLKALKESPVRYDGLHCPKCSGMTVTNVGRIWCPNLDCDYGYILEQPQLITKWCTKGA